MNIRNPNIIIILILHFKSNFLDSNYNEYNELRKYKDDYIKSSCFI